MMIWDEIKNIPSGKKQLREFGLTMAVFFGLISAWRLWHHHSYAETLCWVAAGSLLLALFVPSALKPFQKIWMSLALVMGLVMSRILLSALFYMVLTPIAFFLRITGKELLQQKWKEKKDTFWMNHAINDPKRGDYEKQY